MPSPQKQEVMVHGKPYITIKHASELSLYTHDYIGQRARNGYLASEKINGERYVSKDEFLEYARTTGKLRGAELNNNSEVKEKDSRIRPQGVAFTKKSFSTYYADPLIYFEESYEDLIPHPSRASKDERQTKDEKHTSVNWFDMDSRYFEEKEKELNEIFDELLTDEFLKTDQSEAISRLVIVDETPTSHKKIEQNYPTNKNISTVSKRPVGSEVRLTPEKAQSRIPTMSEHNQELIKKVIHIVDGDESEYTDNTVKNHSLLQKSKDYGSFVDALNKKTGIVLYSPRVLAIPSDVISFFKRQSLWVKIMTGIVPITALIIVITSFNIFDSLDSHRPAYSASVAKTNTAETIADSMRLGVEKVNSVLAHIADVLYDKIITY